MSQQLNETRLRLHSAQGHLNYSLEMFGDDLAKREGYRGHTGIEAIQFYLVHKFGWLPGDVRAMSLEDVRFVMTEEMEGWTMPKDAPRP